jgi:hypothetical protein
MTTNRIILLIHNSENTKFVEKIRLHFSFMFSFLLQCDVDIQIIQQ